jgi:NADH dehydrogenase
MALTSTLTYDTLIVATSMNPFYFERDDWAEIAPGLITVEDALEMRRRIFAAFESGWLGLGSTLMYFL